MYLTDINYVDFEIWILAETDVSVSLKSFLILLETAVST